MRLFSGFALTLSLVLTLGTMPALAQTTATANEKAIGTSCVSGAAGVDFDVLAQCTSTSATAGTMQKAPLFVGALTSPPYASTACDSAKAGMIQYTGAAFQGCNGTSWGSLPTTNVLGSSATLTGPQRSGDFTTGLFSPATGTVAISVSGVEVLRVTSTSNVGIGTNTPSMPLHVVSTGGSGTAVAYMDGDNTAAAPSQIAIRGRSNNDQQLLLGYNTASDYGSIQAVKQGAAYKTLALNPSAGNVGIGTAYPDATLTVSAQTGTFPLRLYGGNAAGIYPSGTGGLYYGENFSNGNAEIDIWNTYSPSTYTNTGIRFLQKTATATYTDTLFLKGNGNVGVGTTNPVFKLETNGTAKILSTSGSVPLYLAYSTYSASPWRIGPDSNNSFVVYNNSSAGVYIVSGGTSWNANSDIRLKRNVSTYSILDKIDSYRAVSFDWKESGHHEVGVIAQEIYPIFPEIVNKGDDDLSQPVSMGGKNAWGVSYDRLGALSMQGVKELYSLVKELKAENEALRASDKELRDRIEKLEAKIK